MLKIASWIGRRMDFHCTGLGKALMAHLGEQEIDRLIEKYGLLRHNEHTIRSPSALKVDLAEQESASTLSMMRKMKLVCAVSVPQFLIT